MFKNKHLSFFKKKKVKIRGDKVLKRKKNCTSIFILQRAEIVIVKIKIIGRTTPSVKERKKKEGKFEGSRMNEKHFLNKKKALICYEWL